MNKVDLTDLGPKSVPEATGEANDEETKMESNAEAQAAPAKAELGKQHKADDH